MAWPIQSKTRAQIRQAIGYRLGDLLLGTFTSSSTAVGATEVYDSYNWGFLGNGDLKGRDFYIYSGTTGNIGNQRKVISSSSTGYLATLSAAPTTGVAIGDGYEIYSIFSASQINDAINQAIRDATDEILVEKIDDTSLFREKYKYEYAKPTGFVGLHKIEYVSAVKINHLIHACDVVWDELVDGDVTATADTDVYKEGGASLKLVVGALAAANDILATDSITSLDISDCDQLVAWVYSSTALDAGDIHILLDNTASCASPLETLDVPAVSANTWTRVTIDLGNPYSDTAIISVGLEMEVDKAAFTLYVDDIRAEKSTSRMYGTIPPDEWYIVQKSTPIFKLTSAGYNCAEDNARLRLNGYQLPSELTSDSTTCSIDPDFVAAKATSNLLMSKARARDMDADDNFRRATYWATIAEQRMRNARTQIENNTRWLI